MHRQVPLYTLGSSAIVALGISYGMCTAGFGFPFGSEDNGCSLGHGWFLLSTLGVISSFFLYNYRMQWRVFVAAMLAIFLLLFLNYVLGPTVQIPRLFIVPALFFLVALCIQNVTGMFVPMPTDKLVRHSLDANISSRPAGRRSAAIEDTSAENSNKSTSQWDVFISHASEDKESFVHGLAEELKRRGVRVWYDSFTLTLGDNLRIKIEQGLRDSRYGVVVFSPGFFSKHWPQKELDGLFALEKNGRKVILPVWHNVTRNDVLGYAPLLADRLAISSSEGLSKVVEEIINAIGNEKSATSA